MPVSDISNWLVNTDVSALRSWQDKASHMFASAITGALAANRVLDEVSGGVQKHWGLLLSLSESPA